MGSPTPRTVFLLLCCATAAFSLKMHDVPIGSFQTKTATACFEGPLDYVQGALSRAMDTSLAGMYQGMEVEPITCADRGFHQTMDKDDECWPGAGKFIPNHMVDIAHYVMGREGFPNLFRTYEEKHGLATGYANDWAVCGACDADSRARTTCQWFTVRGEGAEGECGPNTTEPFYNKDYCAEVLESAKSHPSAAKLVWPVPVYSFLTKTGTACFEGEKDYLQGALNKALATSLAAMYHGMEVKEMTCEEQGFWGRGEDNHDECWSNAEKMLPNVNQKLGQTTYDGQMEAYNHDVQAYAFDGLFNLFYTYDAENGLRDGSAVDWAICGACDDMSRVRTTELWKKRGHSDATTFYSKSYMTSVIQNTTLYSKEYCADVLAKAKPYPDAAELDWP